MASNSLRFEDRLDGASNFLSWKVRVTLLLEENDLWDIVKDVVVTPIDPRFGSSQEEGSEIQVDDHGCYKGSYDPSHIQEEYRQGDVQCPVGLYQSKNINMKMILHNKLRSVEMTRSDTVTNYLMKVTQIRDQLAVVGEKVEDKELVNMALNGFSPQWETFVQGVCARENLPSWERLWDDCIQEETQMESKGSKTGR
jgi:hypothetical protein